MHPITLTLKYVNFYEMYQEFWYDTLFYIKIKNINIIIIYFQPYILCLRLLLKTKQNLLLSDLPANRLDFGLEPSLLDSGDPKFSKTLTNAFWILRELTIEQQLHTTMERELSTYIKGPQARKTKDLEQFGAE